MPRFSNSLFFAVVALLLTGASSAPYYDEIYDADGKPRPGYDRILEAYERLTEKQKLEILQKTAEDFGQDNMLSPIPRVLTTREYGELKKGTEQRAKALHAFLNEYYSGGSSYLSVIPKDVIDRIAERTGEAYMVGTLNPKALSFPYGPDIIRDASGAWRVVEDNPGWIGGMGDLKIARESLFKQIPEYKGKLNLASHPMDYYRALVKKFEAKANPPGGRILLYSVPPYPDNEDLRLNEIFKSLGVEVVTPGSRDPRLVTEGGKAFLERKLPDGSRTREAVGYAIINTEHDNLKLVNRELSRLVKNGSIPANFAPGAEMVGDKEFYVYVEDLIRHYLNQEPILKNIPTERFLSQQGGKNAVNEELLERVLRHRKDYVLKAVDGRGGDSVWVGAKIPKEEFESVKKQILREPGRFIAQKYTPLSVVDDNIVDLRMISHVDYDGVTVASTPWGRGLPRNGNGKVNLSDQGREFTVLVVREMRCRKGFAEMGARSKK